MNAIILKHEMPIDAALAMSLIKKYGAAHMMVNGSLPEPVDVEDIEPTDVFKVCINYGNEVRLVLEDEANGTIEITLERLFGQCEGYVEDGVRMPAEWHAVAEV